LSIAIDTKSATKDSAIAILGKFLGVFGLKLKVTKSKTNSKGKKDKIYQIDSATWQDGRDQIFAVWRRNFNFDQVPEFLPAPVLTTTPAADRSAGCLTTVL
jgi:hypothetical protein